MLYCWKTTNAGPRECTWFTGPHVVKAEIIRMFEAIAVSAVIGFRIWQETNGFETLRSSIHPDLRVTHSIPPWESNVEEGYERSPLGGENKWLNSIAGEGGEVFIPEDLDPE
ncbi:hypothetical protein DIZ76_015805 [Coccidioides immitis]|uniref:Uncharacterized protein n=2 Tax=Coccidioides immitis TaxID=5501 RepID=A0A0J8QKD3_COCIT|nr:hypothetical protein CIRG_05210 [Coccidioides immitis RMSCC 2394]KMU72894.1 hypothetical protein CISG_09855 [Coccidioides immitis RMSCC 3703]TPX21841.1 hypothetical protein DIZ76_015805 [Coccidioides immitis]